MLSPLAGAANAPRSLFATAQRPVSVPLSLLPPSFGPLLTHATYLSVPPLFTPPPRPSFHAAPFLARRAPSPQVWDAGRAAAVRLPPPHIRPHTSPLPHASRRRVPLPLAVRGAAAPASFLESNATPTTPHSIPSCHARASNEAPKRPLPPPFFQPTLTFPIPLMPSSSQQRWLLAGRAHRPPKYKKRRCLLCSLILQPAPPSAGAFGRESSRP